MSKNAKRQIKEIQARQTAKARKQYEEKFPEAIAFVEEALDSLENFPLTELQQRLINYLRSNTDDVVETLNLLEN